MPLIQIKHRFNGSILAEIEAESVREALIKLAANGADLTGADLEGANLPTGETFERYESEVVPALLTAGGKSLDEVLSTGCWDCHSWSNCPMHAAFGADEFNEVPILYRPRAEQFVQLFDARLLAKPSVEKTA